MAGKPTYLFAWGGVVGIGSAAEQIGVPLPTEHADPNACRACHGSGALARRVYRFTWRTVPVKIWGFVECPLCVRRPALKEFPYRAIINEEE